MRRTVLVAEAIRAVPIGALVVLPSLRSEVLSVAIKLCMVYGVVFSCA